MPKVSFEMESVTVEIPEGKTIWDAAKLAGIALHRGFGEAHHCDGNGWCVGSAWALSCWLIMSRLQQAGWIDAPPSVKAELPTERNRT